MEESIERSINEEEHISNNMNAYMKEVFHLKEVNPNTYSPLSLAYIGDCVYDLLIKNIVLNKGNKQVQKLHKETSSLVQASAQSEMMRGMQEILTEEETRIYKRGRNAKSVSPAKNQSVIDYRRATGFEALLGYLYLQNQWKRMIDLVKVGLDSIEYEY